MSAANNKKLKELVQEGLRFFDRQNWESAVDCFTKAQALDPNHPVPYLFGSLAHLANGDADTSKYLLEEGLKLRPRNTFAHNIAALHAFQGKEIHKALDLLKQYGITEHPRIQAFLLLGIEKALLEIDS